MASKQDVVWFEEVGKEDVGLVGGKGANLGEMTTAGIPVPYGFIVTSSAYFDYIKEAQIAKQIKDILSPINSDNHGELKSASEDVQQLILNSRFPDKLAQQISSYYDDLALKEESFFGKMSVGRKIAHGIKKIGNLPYVAVRSSATAEDLPGASFAGQQETYLNIQGETHLIQKIKECYASLFTQRAIYYRHQQGFDHFKVGLAAVVQRMVQSDRSGIAFSIDPVTNEKNKIVIEAIFGLGEFIVQGRVTPDHYEIDKRSFVITQKVHKYQSEKYEKSGRGNRVVKLSKKAGSAPKLTDTEITEIALLVTQIEKHYFFPQDIEWAIEGSRVYIVQSRPITTIGQDKKGAPTDADASADLSATNRSQPILTGDPAAPGIGVGEVVIIQSPREIERVVRGSVLVAPQTNPDYVPAMKKASAIVTERGGRTSHAAIVSRELGIPAVVGATGALKVLKHEKIISVNGATGEIYRGSILSSFKKKEQDSKEITPIHKKLKTLTHVYVNLAEPELARRVAEMDVDGIGLLRAEFMMAQLGVHPKVFIREGKEDIFIRTHARNLLKFVEPFRPRPVVYRATDFKTNEYRNLKGGARFEPHEENPMLGYRGASRYVADPDVFALELEAIRQVWEKGYHNLHLMIPFVRAPWELVQIKTLVAKAGLDQLPGFKLWIMVEVPAAALSLEEFIKIGIDGVSIGTNDLTMMLLGVDRDNENVAHIYDERSPVVVSVLEKVVRTCVQYGITASICGQAASDYPAIVERLIAAGITSVSVTPDAVVRTRELIFEIEKRNFEKLKNK